MLTTRSIGIFLFCLFAIPQISSAQARSAEEETAQMLARLESVIPAKPTEVTPEIYGLMEQAGSTKRLDAASLLIRALAFNWSVSGSNEYKGLFEMITAAPILQRDYGASALPLLLFQGVTTDQEWMRKRIAFVVKTLAGRQELARVVEAFSLKTSDDPKARQFTALLEQSQIDIYLANPALESAEQLIEILRKDKKPPIE